MNKTIYVIVVVFFFISILNNTDAGDLIQQMSATGTRNLRPFTVNDNWEIQWDSKSGIHIGIRSLDGKLVAEGGSSLKPGQGSSYHPRGGTYYLEITSMDDWNLTVVQLNSQQAPSLAPLPPSDSTSSDSTASPTMPLSDFQWSRSKYGTLFVSFAVNNSTDQALKDFTIACATYGISGTRIGTVSKTLYEILPANSEREYEGVEVGPMHPQARTVRCSIVRTVRQGR